MTDPKKPKAPAVTTPAASPPETKPAVVADIGVLLYRDKAAAPRENSKSEGAANFATTTANAIASVAERQAPPEAA